MDDDTTKKGRFSFTLQCNPAVHPAVIRLKQQCDSLDAERGTSGEFNRRLIALIEANPDTPENLILARLDQLDGKLGKLAASPSVAPGETKKEPLKGIV